MKIRIETPVAQDHRAVFAGFNRDLFEALSPPGVPVKLLRFDGSRVGDEVHLALGFGPLSQVWVSEITAETHTDEESSFVDEGRQLPFFLKRWRHAHRIVREGDGARIIDDIEFSAPLPGMGLLVYPMLYFQFRARRPVYQRVFGHPA